MTTTSTTATSSTTGTTPSAAPRLSFGSWAFAFGPFESHPWPIDRIARYLVDAGYDGIELNGFRPHPHHDDHPDAASVEPLRSLLDDLGLGISGYAPDFHAVPPADVASEDYLATVDATLRMCRLLGVSTLRTDTVSPPGPFDRERFDRLTTAWRAAAQRAEDQGVRLVWEFEPGFWLNRPSEVVRTVAAVDHPNFTVLFDTSHAYTGAVCGARHGERPEILEGGVVEYARMLAGTVGHLHLIDSDGSLHDDDTSAHRAFGTGDIDFPAVLDALRNDVATLPWWTVDFCFEPTTEAGGRDAVPVVRELIAGVTAGTGVAS